MCIISMLKVHLCGNARNRQLKVHELLFTQSIVDDWGMCAQLLCLHYLYLFSAFFLSSLFSFLHPSLFALHWMQVEVFNDLCLLVWPPAHKEAHNGTNRIIMISVGPSPTHYRNTIPLTDGRADGRFHAVIRLLELGQVKRYRGGVPFRWWWGDGPPNRFPLWFTSL